MGIFRNLIDKFKPVQTLEVVSQNPIVYTGPTGSLAKGAWVRCPDGRIGILVGIGPTARVVMTTAAGTNIMEIVDEQMVPVVREHPMHSLVRARIADVPITRYESREQLIALGYGD